MVWQSAFMQCNTLYFDQVTYRVAFIFVSVPAMIGTRMTKQLQSQFTPRKRFVGDKTG